MSRDERMAQVLSAMRTGAKYTAHTISLMTGVGMRQVIGVMVMLKYRGLVEHIRDHRTRISHWIRTGAPPKRIANLM